MAYQDYKSRVAADWPLTLSAILERARAVGPAAVLAFDLDSTLLDNRPRQARIVREFGRVHALEALGACAPHHWDNGWDMRAAMRNCGLPAHLVEAVYADAKRFWLERFFTSDYCLEDVAIPGAAAFTHAVAATGAALAYVTGRPDSMRPGTVERMRQLGLALPGEGRVHLIMKPTLREDDDAFKRAAHAHLGELGTVVAAFDNEPTHANDYRRNFPDATVVHLATDHSGRPVALLEGIVSVPHFHLGP